MIDEVIYKYLDKRINFGSIPEIPCQDLELRKIFDISFAEEIRIIKDYLGFELNYPYMVDVDDIKLVVMTITESSGAYTIRYDYGDFDILISSSGVRIMERGDVTVEFAMI